MTPVMAPAAGPSHRSCAPADRRQSHRHQSGQRIGHQRQPEQPAAVGGQRPGHQAGAGPCAEANAQHHRPQPRDDRPQRRSGKHLPQVGEERRQHQQRRRLGRAHDERQQAHRDGRQAQADHALGEARQHEHGGDKGSCSIQHQSSLPSACVDRSVDPRSGTVPTSALHRFGERRSVLPASRRRQRMESLPSGADRSPTLWLTMTTDLASLRLRDQCLRNHARARGGNLPC